MSALCIIASLKIGISNSSDLSEPNQNIKSTNITPLGVALPETETQSVLVSRLESFLQWFKQHEGSAEKVLPVLSINARIHLRTKVPIKTGEALIETPAFLTVNADDVRATQEGKLASAKLATLTWGSQDKDFALLAIWLAKEAAFTASSVYEPFLDLLPSSIAHLPIAFSPRHMQLLNLTSGIKSAVETYLRRTHQVSNLVQTVLEAGNHDHRSPRFAGVSMTVLSAWAVAVVQSTALPFPRSVEDRTQVLTLVPGINLINHAHHSVANQPSARFSKDPSGKVFPASFTLRAKHDMPAGSDVFLSYFVPSHKYCQLDLLLQYGFTEVGDAADCAAIELDVSSSVFSSGVRESTSALRKSKLVEAGMLHPDETERAAMIVTLRFNQSLAGKAAQYLRLANMDLEDIRVDDQRTKLTEAITKIQSNGTVLTGSKVGDEVVTPAFVLMSGTTGSDAPPKDRGAGYNGHSTARSYGIKSPAMSPADSQFKLYADLRQTALNLQQMSRAMQEEGSDAGGLAASDAPSAADSGEEPRFERTDIDGSRMISYQNELRTLRMFLHLLADAESKILQQMRSLAAQKLIDPNRDTWSLVERNVMRVHEGAIRALRWHAEEVERVWVRLLYQPEMFWEPARLPKLRSHIPWRNGVIQTQ